MSTASPKRDLNAPNPLLNQPQSTFSVSPDERKRLVITVKRIGKQWIVKSRYGDDTWWVSGAATNVRQSDTKVDFRKLPREFVEVTKAMFYRLIRRGRQGGRPPRGATIVRLMTNVRLCLEHLSAAGVTRLSDATPDHFMDYVAACNRTGKYVPAEAGKSLGLSPQTRVKRFQAVEMIVELSHYTDDSVREHPWPDSSADLLAGVGGGSPRHSSQKTPLMPDSIFVPVFQRAWSIVRDADRLLDLRDAVARVESEHDSIKSWTMKSSRLEMLRGLGWSGDMHELKKRLREIRTACYIVIASLSGCRNHEMAHIRFRSYSATKDNLGEAYWWLESRSTKTGQGLTTWMVPDAAVQALRVMDRWAAPIQARLRDEIEGYRRADPLDPRIAEASEHLDAIFVGIDSAKGNIVRTISNTRWNVVLNEFVRESGLEWDLDSHQFRRKFANYAAKSRFGDLRYLKDHFKHWSMDMTLHYALNEVPELELYFEVDDELDDLKAEVVKRWLDGSEQLAGGYGARLMIWRNRADVIPIFRDRKHMVRAIADSTYIRSNGHSWCTADDDQCAGNELETTRCGGEDCSNAVIDRRFAPIYQGIHRQMKELEDLSDIGEGGRTRVKRDVARCAHVLEKLGVELNLTM